jgi:hypothetical protein
VHSVDPPHPFVLRSIELLATEVAPALGWTPRGGGGGGGGGGGAGSASRPPPASTGSATSDLRPGGTHRRATTRSSPYAFPGRSPLRSGSPSPRS